MRERPPGASRLRFWPWLVLALTAIPAVWYVLDFENDIDPELPGVVRPTFSPYPPAAYRFAEACDTIDHVAVYVSSAALVLAAWGWFRNPRERIWAAAVALSAAGFWHAATPGPLADGWYGLGWRTIFDTRAPAANRIILAGLAAGVAAIIARALLERPFRSEWNAARTHGILGLLLTAAILMVMRQVGWLDWEPIGFWPRWFYVWGLLAWAFASGAGRTDRSARLVARRNRRTHDDGFDRPRLRRTRPVLVSAPHRPSAGNGPGSTLSERHADLSRSDTRSGTLPLSHDHQPLSRVHPGAESVLARRASIRPRARLELCR